MRFSPLLALRRPWLFVSGGLAFGILLFMLLGGMAQAVAPAYVSAQAAMQQDRSPVGIPNGPAGSCALAWKQVARPSGAVSVYTLAADDAWAVGYAGFHTQTVTMRWNGTAWNIIPSPNPGAVRNYLADVIAFAPNDAWAVGTIWTEAYDSLPLILHWDGSAWTQVESTTLGYLEAIDAVSPDDIWAVGSTGANPLTMHWDGSNWTEVPSPGQGTEWDHLLDVSAISTDDVWAVGEYRDGGGTERTLTMHWNGSAWAVVPSPNVGPSDDSRNLLYSVDGVAGDDVWAVGEYTYPKPPEYDFNYYSVILHWDGTEWVSVPHTALKEETAGPYRILASVAVVSADDVWAAGRFGILHWDGAAWSTRTLPDAELPKVYIVSMSARAPDDIWAIGGAVGSQNQTYPLALRYSTECSPPVPPPTPTPVPLRCPGERFTDVCPDDYFYTPVLNLNDRGVVSGYNSTPPCDTPQHVPCFKPYNNITRGQAAKLVALASGVTQAGAGQLFEDVAPGSPFYGEITALADRDYMGGYPCGSPAEPCVAPQNRPYFRPGNSITRGQLSKIVSNTAGFEDEHSSQTFQDVPPDSPFYIWVERIASRGIVYGYNCGGPGEVCIQPDYRPYFRPNTQITRGQTAKVVHGVWPSTPQGAVSK